MRKKLFRNYLLFTRTNLARHLESLSQRFPLRQRSPHQAWPSQRSRTRNSSSMRSKLDPLLYPQ